MYCPHCGSPADSKFCPTCGKKTSNFGQSDSALATATFWQRAGATLLDGLIAGLPIGVLVAVFTGASSATSSGLRAGLGLPELIAAALVGLYTIYFLSRPNGQTIGDRIMKIKVISIETGGPLTVGQATSRWLFSEVFSLLGALAIIGFLDILWCLWDKKGQTLHDKFAKTTVVKL
jgi:uncharacterized RDD family membrane protein YckC